MECSVCTVITDKKTYPFVSVLVYKTYSVTESIHTEYFTDSHNLFCICPFLYSSHKNGGGTNPYYADYFTNTKVLYWD